MTAAISGSPEIDMMKNAELKPEDSRQDHGARRRLPLPKYHCRRSSAGSRRGSAGGFAAEDVRRFGSIAGCFFAIARAPSLTTALRFGPTKADEMRIPDR
ncbi:hypothetical protein [Mesorhizobium sp. B283B1A]|uniref:hypothetical protein n=1 Tax=Mesorhizobium TaxID=68287 RepID=UPI00398CE221